MKWMICTTLALVSLVGFQEMAWACSEQLPPLEVNVAPVSDGETIGFWLSDSFEVHERVVLRQGDVEFEGEVIDHGGVFTFKPAETLAPGEYELQLLIDSTYVISAALVTVETLPAFEFDVQQEVSIYEYSKDSTCCSTQEGGCSHSCGTCYSCWPKSYEYVRQVQISVNATQPVIVEWEFVSETGLDLRRAVFGGFGAGVLNFKDLDSPEACARVVVKDLLGEEIERRDVCVPATDFPKIERRTPDARSAVIQCAEAPDDTEDINWQRYGNESKVGGCSTGAGGLAWWLVLLGLGFRRRRME